MLEYKTLALLGDRAAQERLTEHGELLEMLPRIERWEVHTHDKK